MSGASILRAGSVWAVDWPAVRREVVRLPVSSRGWALFGGAVVSLVYLWVLYRLVVVAGEDPVWLLFVVVGVAGGLAVVLSRVLSDRQAWLVGVGLLAGGVTVHWVVVSPNLLAVWNPVLDAVALLTGVSVFRVARASLWAIGFAPGPLFASWFFFLRGRYILGGIVAGAAAAFFVLTGDVDAVLGLVAALGLLMVVGFGEIDRVGGTAAQRNTVATVVVIVLVAATTVSLVPGGEAQPLLVDDAPEDLEAALVADRDSIEITGSTSLDPEVRFTVTAEQAEYWRVGTYDRYTGSGWVRTGGVEPYEGELEPPLTPSATEVTQRVRVAAPMNTMPAALQPVLIEDGGDRAMVTARGGLQPTETLYPGDEYVVVSLVPEPSPMELQQAGTEYPAAIEERYLQLPADTPPEIEEFTSILTAEAETPYETALVIEHYLRSEKTYSLDPETHGGDVAADFLFLMDEGYSSFFATTMVVMLRTQDIPARFAVGYTPGQRVADDTWVVRGMNIHGYVEVYFPGHGWVEFEPTPGDDQADLLSGTLEAARELGVGGVDTDESAGLGYHEDPTREDPGEPADEPDADRFEIEGERGFEERIGDERELLRGATPVGEEPVPPDDVGVEEDPEAEEEPGLALPSREVLLYLAVLVIGMVTVVYRSGVVQRGYRAVWVRRVPDGPPASRIAGVFARTEYLLGRAHRPRRPDETPREYLAALGSDRVDGRVRAVYDAYEKAQYAGEASRAAAAEAVRAYEGFVDGSGR